MIGALGRFGDRDHESVVRGVVFCFGCFYSDILKWAVKQFNWLVEGTSDVHRATSEGRTRRI